MPSVSEQEVEFENTSINSNQHHWDFGNGFVSQIANPFSFYSGNNPNT
jgi:hypothetical protein